MKKSILIVVLFVAAISLGGCTLGGFSTSNISSTAVPTSNVLKSSDSGKTWEMKTDSSAKINLAGLDVLNIAINPYDSNNIFVGTKGVGILKTEDGGSNWSYLANFQSEKVYGLAIDPVDGRVIYATGVLQKRGKIFKSLDTGANWQEIYTSASTGPVVISLVIDKKNPKVIFATTSDNQVIKTEDAGGTWKSIFNAQSPVLQVAIDSADDQIVYFNVMDQGIFRLKKGMKAPEDLSTKIQSVTSGNRGINIVLTDPKVANVVYAAGRVGIIKSKDAGNTWEKIDTVNNSEKYPIISMAINPSNSDEIIFGASQAFYRSQDAGKTWATVQFDTTQFLKVLKYNPSNSSIIFSGLGK